MSAPVTWAVIPVKTLSQAKQRLASVLPAEARRRLVLAMLDGLLDTVGGVAGVGATLVVTPDPHVAGLALRKGSRVLREPQTLGLNAAVCAGLERARADGAERVLVLPADVPLATADEIGRLLNTGALMAMRQAVLVPAADGDGTNAILLGPPDAMEPEFGPGSYVRHLSQAVAKRLDVQVLHLPGLAADIDAPADLCRLLGPGVQKAPFQFLSEHVMKAPECRGPTPGADGR